MARVSFHNLPSELEESFFKKAISGVLKKESRSGKINCLFVNEREMAGFNRYYRGKSLPTDVLSFKEEDAGSYLGEIVVCPDWVRKNACRYRRPFEEELKRILIHGTLHLLGYDHERSRKEEKEMIQKQENYLFSKQKG